MLTSAQAAARLGVTPARIRQLAIAGRIRGAYRQGRDWLIPIRFSVQKVRQGRPPAE